MECLQCHKISKGPVVYEESKKEDKSSMAAIVSAVNPSRASLTLSAVKGVASTGNTNPSQKKSSHSFLGLFDKTKKSTPLSGQLLSSPDSIFVSLNDNSTPKNLNSSNGKRKIDLLELEKSNKKKKRDSLDKPTSPYPLAMHGGNLQSPVNAGIKTGLAAAKERLAFNNKLKLPVTSMSTTFRK